MQDSISTYGRPVQEPTFNSESKGVHVRIYHERGEQLDINGLLWFTRMLIFFPTAIFRGQQKHPLLPLNATVLFPRPPSTQFIPRLFFPRAFNPGVLRACRVNPSIAPALQKKPLSQRFVPARWIDLRISKGDLARCMHTSARDYERHPFATRHTQVKLSVEQDSDVCGIHSLRSEGQKALI